MKKKQVKETNFYKIINKQDFLGVNLNNDFSISFIPQYDNHG